MEEESRRKHSGGTCPCFPGACSCNHPSENPGLSKDDCRLMASDERSRDEQKQTIHEDFTISYDFEGFIKGEEDKYKSKIKPIFKMITNQLEELKEECLKHLQSEKHLRPLTKTDILNSVRELWDGSAEIHLPGNLLFPAYLSRRINDLDVPLLETLLEFPNLTTINLAYNDIGDDGVLILGQIIQKHPSISDVNLMHNNMTGSGIVGLCKCLIRRRPLQRLRLTGNKIGDEGMDGITCLIMSGRIPRDLDIGECDLTTEGTETLLSGLRAIEEDIDFPEFLLNKTLPIDLGELRDLKVELNHEGFGRNPIDLVPQFLKKPDEPGSPTIPPTIFQGNHNTIHGWMGFFFEQFGRAIQAGLFDLRSKVHSIIQSQFKDQKEEIMGISETNLLYEETIPERIKSPELVYNEEGLPEILSRSLYSLTGFGYPSSKEKASDSRSSKDSSSNRCDRLDDIVYTCSKEPVDPCEPDPAKLRAVLSEINELLLTQVQEMMSMQQSMNWSSEIQDKAMSDALEVLQMIICGPEYPINDVILRELLWQLMKTTHGAFNSFLSLNPNEFRGDLQFLCKEDAEELDGESLASRIRFVGRVIQRGILCKEMPTRGIEITIAQGHPEGLGIPKPTRQLTPDRGRRTIDGVEPELRGQANSLIRQLFQAVLIKSPVKLVGRVENQMTQREDELSPEKVGESSLNEPSRHIYPFISRPQRLVLSRPIFNSKDAVFLAKKLGEFLKESNLHTMHLDKWELGERGFKALMSGLVDNRSLVLLDLSSNNLGPEWMDTLGKYIANNKSLRHLLLGHNHIRNPGLEALIPYLVNSNLQSLNLTSNQLSGKSIDFFLGHLPKTAISHLYIWGNAYSEWTWKLIEMLKTKEVIKQTDVVLHEFEGVTRIVRNAQFRDVNEWYAAPRSKNYLELQIPPYLNQIKSPVINLRHFN